MELHEDPETVATTGLNFVNPAQASALTSYRRTKTKEENIKFQVRDAIYL